jgi:hypothetical protein
MIKTAFLFLFLSIATAVAGFFRAWSGADLLAATFFALAMVTVLFGVVAKSDQKSP